jgi:alpha-amylase/alpha-mannosidase (GH57 family)
VSTQHQLDVVVCWHMHQPWYLRDGVFTQPWVYLHGLKSYADMAAHLETVPGARAVVNFVPTLLEQLDRYQANIRDHLESGAALVDPLLAALATEALPDDPARRQALVHACLRVNEAQVLGRFPPYQRLARLAREAGDAGGAWLSDRCLADLVTWFHLAWFGEHAHRENAEIAALVDRGRDFGIDHRRRLLHAIGRELAGLIPRYRALAENGRVELSVSPWGHPILPLLLDLHAGREALPDLDAPSAGCYPGGEERADWHLRRAIEAFRHYFDREPAGCWPSEGALSEPAAAAIARAGFRWTASGGRVLHNSLARSERRADCHHRAFRVDGTDLCCFFRDDGLSDLIGFTYQHWAADDAVADLIRHLENVADHCDGPDMIASIIMDGENAWEHYPQNGFDFLQALYRALADHPRLRLTTFSDYLARPDVEPDTAPTLVAGSWVHGTLTTWVGHSAKNRAWDLLAAAKHAYDRRPEAERAADSDLTRELGLSEGSDWFWWLDGHHAAETVAAFEGLYRSHLRALYRLMQEPVPDDLDQPLLEGTAGGDAPTMQPAGG